MGNDEIGIEVRRARKALLLGQEQVAEAAGLSVSSVARLERGGGVSDETLKAVCAVVGLDAAALRRSGPREATVEPIEVASPTVPPPSGRPWGRWLRTGMRWALAAVPLSLIGVEIGAQASIQASVPYVEGLHEIVQGVAAQVRASEINKAATAYSSAVPADSPDRDWQPWKQFRAIEWSACGRKQSGLYAVLMTWDIQYLTGIPVCVEQGIQSLVLRRDAEATEFVLGPIPGRVAREVLALLTADPTVAIGVVASRTPDLSGPSPTWADPRRSAIDVVDNGYVRIQLGRAK